MPPDSTLIRRRIDPEIRDLIMKMNEIPFIETKFSCAGYGKVGDWGDSKKKLRDHSEDGYGSAYISLKYNRRFKAWREFHFELEKISYNTAYDQGRNSYYFGMVIFDKVKFPPSAFERLRTVEELKETWKQVDQLVDKYLRPHRING